MREIDLILKRILERAKQIARLREENAKDRALLSELEGLKPKEEGIQRAFVEGAKWWEFTITGAPLWRGAIAEAEVEAKKRYGKPKGDIWGGRAAGD